MKFITNSPEQTIRLAAKLGKKIPPGTILALRGNLGAGKTHFVKGLAQALDTKQIINSPTFVLLKEYSAGQNRQNIKKLIHIDCYRLNEAEQLLELGWTDYLKEKNNLIVIEWADKIKSLLPPQTRWINISSGRNPQQRLICLK
jgi:tRNA threonylcarbamoyladenosine biosynthesis protein TsaE